MSTLQLRCWVPTDTFADHVVCTDSRQDPPNPARPLLAGASALMRAYCVLIELLITTTDECRATNSISTGR